MTMDGTERRKVGWAALVGAALVVLLKVTYPLWELDLPGERPLPARWDPDLAVRNGFNERQKEMGTSVRMTRAECDEMGTTTGSVGQCVVTLSDGSVDVLTLTMLEDGGSFDIAVERGPMSHGDFKAFFAAACAGDVDLVEHHLDAGVDIDFIHAELQSTALVAAIEEGRSEVALLLLDRGADPTLRSPLEAMTPLEAARAAGLTRVVERLG